MIRKDRQEYTILRSHWIFTISLHQLQTRLIFSPYNQSCKRKNHHLTGGRALHLKKVALILMALTLVFVVAACGQAEESGQETTSAEEGETENNAAETSTDAEADAANETDGSVSGSVVIDGSGTVYPLMSRIAEEYMYENDEVSVEVSRAGTSAGMEKFINGETDFSNASREIKAEEAAQLEENGIEFEEFKVALDGLTIVIHPENTWAAEMTEEEIKTMFVSGALKEDDNVLWSDIRPEWPEEPVNFYGPNENHGTNEFFVEEIIEEQELVEGINLQQEYSTLVNLVSEDKNAIGFFGYGYYANNSDKVKAVHVDFGNGPVEPSLETIKEDGDYAPFTRPVFTYLSVNAAQDKPQVKAFAEYVFHVAGDLAGETGFAPLSQEELEANLERVQSLGQ